VINNGRSGPEDKNMDANSFRGKVYFSLIDKVFIGFMAAGVAFFFQLQQYKYQMLLNATVAASKINTDIVTNQREKLIKEVGGYSLLLEQIKTTGSANDNQIKSLAAHRHQINFIIETLGAVDPKIAKASEPFLKSINNLNNKLAIGPVAKNELNKSTDTILTQYMNVLKTIQKAGIYKTMEEIQIAIKEAKQASRRKSLSPVTGSSP
jgi:hypothetical protein